MTLGKRIKAARERLNPELSQNALGAMFDPPLTGQAISAWERGDTIPTSDKLSTLRKALKVSYIWLLDGGGDPPDPDDPEVQFHDLPPGHRATVVAVINTLQSRREDAA